MLDEQGVRDVFNSYKFTPNIGIILGEQSGGTYFVAIDVDDADRIHELLDEHGPLPVTATTTSAHGYHALYTLGEDVPRDRIKNIIGLGKKPGVDVKVTGGQIVAPPSTHPSGVKYTWAKTGDIAELPALWTLAILADPPKPKSLVKYTPQSLKSDKRAQKISEKYLESATLGEASILARTGNGLRNTTLHKSLCKILTLAHGTYLPGAHAYACREISNAARAAGLGEKEIRSTIASVEKWMHDTGAIRVPFLVAARDDSGSIPPPDSNGFGEQREPQHQAPLDEPIELIMDGNGPAKCATNVARLLSEHSIWRGGPQLNIFTDRIEWPSPLPPPLERIRRSSRELIDADEIAIQGWILSQPHALRVKAGVDVVSDGVRQAARWGAVDSLRERAEKLPLWDGVKRLNTWLSTYAGAADTPVTRVFARRWMISAVARALVPGCIADGALVLEGEQGIGKNRLITAIFGDAPWVQSIGAYRIGHNIEADRIAGAAWVVHDDEMGARRSDVDAMKAWISRREDTYRAPYERNLQTRPRRAVIVCSTNRSTYLEDDKNRRFWPVKCGVIDWAKASKDGPQLLAEAMVAYQAGETWTISPSDPLWLDIERQQDARRVSDPIVTNIENALQGLGNPEEITISKLADTVGVQPKDINRSLETRYGLILREMGYYRDRVMKGGVRSYVYKLPSASPRSVGQ